MSSSMQLSWRRSNFSRTLLFPFALILLAVLCLRPHNDKIASSPTSLQGAAALAELKATGEFDSLSQALQQARYRVSPLPRQPLPQFPGGPIGEFAAQNLAHSLRAYFTEDGAVQLVPAQKASWQVGLKLREIAANDCVLSVGTTATSAQNNRVEIRKTSGNYQPIELTEWYVNTPTGLEQGFTLNQRPDTNRTAPLYLTFALTGNLQPKLAADGQAITLTAHDGSAVLQYDKLASSDATGRVLPSRMEVRGQEFSLVVDDAQAVYPITIDPTFTQVKQVTASDGVSDDAFGAAVAISGDTAVVGALYATISGNSYQGAAYIFQRDNGGANNWGEVIKLEDPAGSADDNFGAAVAISGDIVAVGALLGDSVANADDEGAVYIYGRNQGGANNWGLIKKVSASDGANGDSFGWSVYLSGTRLVVGSNFHNSARGAAYLFERDYDPDNPGTPLTDNWGERKKLTASNAATNDQFGYAVAISNETLLVGAYRGDATATNEGSAYIFQRNQGGADNWGEVKKLVASDAISLDHFGAAVALHNDTAVVGAPDDDDAGNSSGSAYVFLRNQGGADNWGQIKKLTAGDAALNDQFGFAVAVDGDIAVVGSYVDNVGLNTDQGSAYAFMRDYDPNDPGTPLTNNWGQFKQVKASDGEGFDQFAYALAFQGETLIVGSYYDDVAETDQGSAYIFKFLSTCPSITLSPSSLPAGTVNTAYGAQTITASGGSGTYTYNVSSGSLPGGMTLDPNTGVLDGTPNAINTFNFTITATDTSTDCVGARAYSLTINGPTWSGATSNDWHTAANWSNNAVPAAGADVTLPASGVSNEVSISTNDVEVNNLTLNAGRTLTLSGNHTLTINGTLILAGGNITATTGSLILVGSAGAITRSSGHIIGSLRKTINATGSFTYHVGTANGYSPVAVTINGGTGDLTITAYQAAMPGLAAPTLALNRYWNLTSTLVSPDLNLGFTYLESDIPGTANESLFRILKDANGSAPITQPGGSTDNVDETTNIASISNVSSFSNWSAGQPDAPLAVQLASLNAYSNKGNTKGGVTIAWQTGFEADHLGFNLYRETRGQRVKLNPALIAGSALLAGERTPLTAGNSYAWTDARGGAGTSYWLEEVDLSGTSIWHGPVTAVGNNPNPNPNPEFASPLPQARLLSELNQVSALPTQTEWAESTNEVANQPDAFSRTVTPGAASNPKTEPWTLPNQTAMKLAVRQTGWYRVTQAELAAAGFNTNINPLLLQLFAEGVEVPIKVIGKAAFGFEALEFYGRGLDLPSTDTRIYWLTFGNGLGRRLETTPARTTDQFTSASFRSTVERKDRLIYFSGLLNGEAENWFGPVINPTGVAQKLTTRFADRNATATLELALQGVTDQVHAVNIEFNGRYLATLNFTGKGHPVQRYELPSTWLLEGENEIKLLSAAGSSDISLVDVLRLTYARGYRAENDSLSFSVAAGQSAFISGFTSPNVRVLQLGGNGATREIAVKPQLVNGSYGFSLVGEGENYLALADSRLERVATITRNQTSNWRATTNAADFIIITHRDFWTSANKLAVMRRINDLRVAVVDVEDVYDEFAYGAHTPQAIKDMLSFASQNWLRKPAYALLLGDASTDPRNYLGFGNFDFVPTWLGATTYFETGLDNWLADQNNDSLPELALGRLPVRTATQAEAVINKILAFKTSTAPRNALLVSDRSVDGYDYKALSGQLANLLPANWTKQQVNRNDGTPDSVRQRIVQIINGQAGTGPTPVVVNWFGHGSTQVWTGDGLLRTQEAAALTNREAGLFVMATCLNGYFLDPQQVSLGEAALTNPTGGAFGVVSSSALNAPAAQLAFAHTLYRSLFTSGLTLGQAMTAARLAAVDRDVRNSYVLFGDPTMRLIPTKAK